MFRIIYRVIFEIKRRMSAKKSFVLFVRFEFDTKKLKALFRNTPIVVRATRNFFVVFRVFKTNKRRNIFS